MKGGVKSHLKDCDPGAESRWQDRAQLPRRPKSRSSQFTDIRQSNAPACAHSAGHLEIPLPALTEHPLVPPTYLASIYQHVALPLWRTQFSPLPHKFRLGGGAPIPIERHNYSTFSPPENPVPNTKWTSAAAMPEEICQPCTPNLPQLPAITSAGFLPTIA
jgi:hypothetical protein